VEATRSVTCPNCGERASADDDRCPACSIPLQVHCPDCGTAAAFDEETCPACGESLAHASDTG